VSRADALKALARSRASTFPLCTPALQPGRHLRPPGAARCGGAAADHRPHRRRLRDPGPRHPPARAEHRHRLRPRPARGHARLHARLPLLPGRDAVPAAARARPGRRDRGREGDPQGDRLRGDRPDEPLDRRLHVRQRGGHDPPPPAPDATVSLPSTRVDAFTVELVDAIVPGGRRGGFTFAPEAGSQRMRDVINKGVSDEEIARCAELAFRRGWSSLKLYFMIGLPGETMDDVLAIADICRRVLEVGRRLPRRQGPGQGERLDLRAQGRRRRSCGPARTRRPRSRPRSRPAKADARRGLDLRWTSRAARSSRRRWAAATAPQRGRPAGVAQRRPLRCLGRALQLRALARGVRGGGARSGLVRPARHPARRASAVGPPQLRRDPRIPGPRLRRALSGKTVADCHWGPCYNCGVPAATGFECQTGEQGPGSCSCGRRPARLSRGTGPASGRRRLGRWRYVGPPGDPRRHGSVRGAAAGTSPDRAMRRLPTQAQRRTISLCRGPPTSWGRRCSRRTQGSRVWRRWWMRPAASPRGDADRPPGDRDNLDQRGHRGGGHGDRADSGDTTLELIRLFVLLVGGRAGDLLARRINLPYTVALVAFGMAAGALSSPRSGSRSRPSSCSWCCCRR
jgi:hypothetical protein